MNKTQLAEIVAEETDLSKKVAADAVNAVLAAIQAAVAAGDKVTITGFGGFEMAHRPARTARNPNTGAEVHVAESWGPKFRPGSDFKELVNVGGQKVAAKRASAKKLSTV